MGKRRFYTDLEIEILFQNFADNYTSYVCELLDRSYHSVANMAKKMGLKKSPEFMKAELQRQAERLKSDSDPTRFQKGHTPKNKGKKLEEHQKDKIRKTFFKKGHTPANTKYDGHERVDVNGYVEVRISKGKYVHKHRMVWEQANEREVPKGHLIVFKDGNKLNIVPENLELITRAEGMKRNSKHQWPKELTETIILLNKVKKIIDEKQN
jgi:hypothetical protein